MAPRSFHQLASNLWAALLSLSLHFASDADAFQLPSPTRPQSFPLQRPVLSGEIVAWGDNSYGQTNVPAGLNDIVAIAAGPNHNLALRSNGTVAAWGDNRFGQCAVPAGLTDVVSVAAGLGHSLALKSDGRVVAWGTNDARIDVPANLTDAISIAADHRNSYAVRIDGRPVSWGIMTEPLDSWTNLVQIAGNGVYRPFALRRDGIVMFSIPAQLTDVHAISGGAYYSYAIRADGSLALGDAGIAPLGLKARDVASTANYVSAAVTSEGTVAVWPGWWSLGHAPGNYPPDPLVSALTNPPPRLRGVLAIEAGDSHFLALKTRTPPQPTTARATAQIVNGFIVGLNVIDGGEGYGTSPGVRIVGGGGSGAIAEAHISDGVVSGFTIINTGRGYTGTPTIEIDSPPFLPTLDIFPTRVGVTMRVVVGRRYQLESAFELPDFSRVGEPFIADRDLYMQEFSISGGGKYFRISEVP